MSSKVPFFSVVINCFNYGRYLGRAIESVMSQTMPRDEVEIIIVDDGSTDDTPLRANAYGGAVTYIRQPNGGQASAINCGVGIATGRVIALLDADDFWYPEKLARIAATFQSCGELDFVYHYLDVVDERLKVVDHYVVPPRFGDRGPDGGLSCRERFLGGMLPFFPPTSALAVRADCLRKSLPISDDFRAGADLCLHHVLLLYARGVRLIPRSLGAYCMHGQNLSGGLVWSVEKLWREAARVRSVIRAVEEHGMRTGSDTALVRGRLCAVLEVYRILRAGLEGRRLKATKDALCFDKFLPVDGPSAVLQRRLSLLIGIWMPGMYYRLQGLLRLMRYYWWTTQS